MKFKILLFALAVLVITALVAASPMGSGIRAKLQCFTEEGNCVEGWNGTDIILYSDAGSTAKFTVDGATGNSTFKGTADFSNATVSGISTSTLTSLTVNGDVVISDTLKVTSTTSLIGATTATGAIAANGGLTVDSPAFSVADTSGNTTIGGSLTANGGITADTRAFTVADATGDTVISGTLKVTDTMTTIGAADVGGALTYGSDNLYPLGYASASQQMVCGRTSTFTASTTVSVSGLTTVTYVLPVQVTAPITTAAYLYHSIPTTTTFDLTSLENDFDAGSTGIVAEWCAVGDQ